MSKKQMIKKISLVLLSCLVIFSSIIENVKFVYADVTASIDVLYEQKFIDANGATVLNADQKFTYELIAADPSNPMPAGSTGGEFEESLRGNENGSMTIVFSKAGTFEYTLQSSGGNDLRGFIPASEMEYRIEITVLKKIDGSLDPFVFAFNSDGEKVVDPPFIYTVQLVKEPTVSPKPTATPKQVGKGGNLRTGDTTKMFTLVALAVASTGVIILAIAKRRKRDDEI